MVKYVFRNIFKTNLNLFLASSVVFGNDRVFVIRSICFCFLKTRMRNETAWDPTDWLFCLSVRHIFAQLNLNQIFISFANQKLPFEKVKNEANKVERTMKFGWNKIDLGVELKNREKSLRQPKRWKDLRRKENQGNIKKRRTITLTYSENTVEFLGSLFWDVGGKMKRKFDWV